MTRLFTEGAEMQDALLSTFSFISSSTVLTNESANPAISPYYYYISCSTGSGGHLRKAITAATEIYVRTRVMIPEVINSDHWPISIWSGTTLVARVGLAAGTIVFQVMSSTTILEASLVSPVQNVWNLLEIYFKLADAPNGRFVLYVDGNKLCDFTGDTKIATPATFDSIGWGGDSDREICIDDIAINDTAGAVDNSYCGDGIVVKVEPNGNGTHNNWHGSDADDVDNYQMCHEFPKDDDTTYVYHDNTSGVQQQFAMSHLSFTGYTILRIWAEARARKTAASAMTLKLGQLAAGGADVVSAGRALYTDAYNRVVGDDSFVNPVDTNPWEEADIDAIEFVAQVT